MKTVPRFVSVIVIISCIHFLALHICEGETPKTQGKLTQEKATQEKQFIAVDEVTAIVKREADITFAKLKENQEKQINEITNQKLQISEGYLKIANSILSSIAWFAAITSAIISILTFLGVKFGVDWVRRAIKEYINKVEETAKDEISRVKVYLENEIQGILSKANESLQRCDQTYKEVDKVQKLLEQSKGEIDIQKGRFFMRMGFLQWELGRIETGKKKRLLEFAIVDTETALKLNPPSESLVAQIKSNLSYFYAESEDRSKKEDALKFATEAKELASQYGDKASNWLANYGYVRMKYSDSKEELDTAISYLKSLENNPVISEEIKIYLAEADKIGAILKKSQNGGTGSGDG